MKIRATLNGMFTDQDRWAVQRLSQCAGMSDEIPPPFVPGFMRKHIQKLRDEGHPGGKRPPTWRMLISLVTETASLSIETAELLATGLVHGRDTAARYAKDKQFDAATQATFRAQVPRFEDAIQHTRAMLGSLNSVKAAIERAEISRDADLIITS